MANGNSPFIQLKNAYVSTLLLSYNIIKANNLYQCNIPLKAYGKEASNQKISVSPDLEIEETKAIKNADEKYGDNDLSTLAAIFSKFKTTNVVPTEI